jgi:hypothetical protein
MAWEKTAAVIAVIVFAFGGGVAWNGLDNRIEKVDEKIEALADGKASAACMAILTRQIAAIESQKRSSVAEGLERMSRHYDCGRRKEASLSVSEDNHLVDKDNYTEILLRSGARTPQLA